MIEVSKKVFFEIVGPLDVHPSMRDPYQTWWELKDRTIIGKSLPGWKEPGAEKKWFLTAEAFSDQKKAG